MISLSSRVLTLALGEVSSLHVLYCMVLRNFCPFFKVECGCMTADDLTQPQSIAKNGRRTPLFIGIRVCSFLLTVACLPAHCHIFRIHIPVPVPVRDTPEPGTTTRTFRNSGEVFRSSEGLPLGVTGSKSDRICDVSSYF